MIRISQIRLPVRYTQEQLEQKIRRALKLRDGVVFSSRIVRKSIDARRKPEIFYSLTVDVSTAGEEKILKKISDRNIMAVKERVYEIPERASAKSGGGVCGDAGTNYRHPRPVIAGAGPAGLFCAYALVQRGLAPVIVERGKRVEERMRDVEAFWEKGHLFGREAEYAGKRSGWQEPLRAGDICAIWSAGGDPLREQTAHWDGCALGYHTKYASLYGRRRCGILFRDLSDRL